MPETCKDIEISILYVEDEPETREMVSRVLAQEIPTIRLHTAENGETGLALYREHLPEIVITDINMPVMDGIRMGTEIKSLNPEAIIIAVTAHSDTSYLIAAIETGISNYVLKPIDYDRLFAAIAKGIETVTLKKRLREQDDHIRQLSRAVEDNPCCVVITDSKGVIEYVNPKFTELTGYSSEKTIGQTPRILKSGRMPPEIYEKLWGTINSGRVWRGEFVNRKVNGELYWESASISPIFDDQGSIAHFVAVKEDITERKRAEEILKDRDSKLRRAEEMAQLGHWHYDLATGQISWSDGMYRIFGLGRDEVSALSLEKIATYCHPDDREHCIQSYDPFDFGSSFEYRIVLPDGNERNVVSKGEPMRYEDGTLVALFGTLLDTTELRRTERELREKSAELERFTYMISHDMKSPLVTFRTFLQYLENDMATNNAGRIVKDMHFMRVASDRMGRLLEDLLEMLRVGQTANQPECVACGDLIDDALNLLAGTISEGGIEVKAEVPDILLFGDRPRLVEIWQNLVENACKFMGDQAHPRIEIGIERLAGDVVFFVRDNGVGIESEYQDKVFELFEKLNKNVEGTGLGLAIVRRIVELNGGKIWMESPGRGQGTCFRFTLPGPVKNIEDQMQAA